eukprot:TRINITY_DN5535_c0_g1_i1.p1 TRINITY_DN5535_c0_g1~~TRINITY_DN5535_c0_g1_i1.p1  ORF type:complete len:444 (-),score=144.83 TRINITY_DN5535_c0_g1_i1:77-1378(-)
MELPDPSASPSRKRSSRFETFTPSPSSKKSKPSTPSSLLKRRANSEIFQSGVVNFSKKLDFDDEENDKDSLSLIQEINTKEEEKVSKPQEPSSLIPLDFSIKIDARIYSKSGFQWLNKPDIELNEKKNERYQSFLNATRVYSHPPSPQIPSFVLEMCHNHSKIEKHLQTSEQVLSAKFFQHFVNTWKDSFESLYESWKNGSVEYFYYHWSAHCVLFRRSKNNNGENKTQVSMSRSTWSVRNHFREEEIQYLSPLLPSLQEESGSASSTPKRSKSAQLTGREANTSLLIFEGEKEAYEVFRYLHEFDSYGFDLPMLYSTSPFLNCSMHQIEVKSNEKVQRTNNEGGRREETNCLALEGPILPHHLERLCSLLEETQKEYSISVTTLKDTSSFNIQKRSGNKKKEEEEITDQKQVIKSMEFKQGRGYNIKMNTLI